MFKSGYLPTSTFKIAHQTFLQFIAFFITSCKSTEITRQMTVLYKLAAVETCYFTSNTNVKNVFKKFEFNLNFVHCLFNFRL